MTFTPLHIAILKALARYFFLCNSQLVFLGIGHATSIREATCFLSSAKPPLLYVNKFPVDARFGRMEYVYSLSQGGHEVFEELTGVTSCDMVLGWYGLDYFHRKSLIEFQIRLDQYLARETNLVMSDRKMYYRKERPLHGRPKWAETRVVFSDGSFFIPDMFFSLSLACPNDDHSSHAAKTLFSVEYVQSIKKTRTIRQIKKHIQGIRDRVVAERFRLPRGQDYVSLFLFADEGLRDRVVHALETQPSFLPYRDHFLFASLEDIRRDVARCWYRVGDREHLFNCITGNKAYRLREHSLPSPQSTTSDHV